MSNYGGPTYHEIMSRRQAEADADPNRTVEVAQRVRDAIESQRMAREGTPTPFPEPPADVAALLIRDSSPRVGHVPGGVRPPAETQTAPYRSETVPPKLTIPGVQMTVWMVWAVDDEDPDQVPWLVGARDDAAVQADPEAWETDVTEAREAWGDVLITRTSVDYGKVRAAFEPLDI